MRNHCICTSTYEIWRILIQLNNSPPLSFLALRSTQLIFHSQVLWSEGLITADPRALTVDVAAAVLMVVLPCLWPGHPAPQHSAACLSPPPGGRAQATLHLGTDCFSSAPPSPSSRYQIHNPALGEHFQVSTIKQINRQKVWRVSNKWKCWRIWKRRSERGKVCV